MPFPVIPMPHHTRSTIHRPIHRTIHGTTRRLLAIVGALLLPAGADAAPDDPGRIKARQVCSVCHGLARPISPASRKPI